MEDTPTANVSQTTINDIANLMKPENGLEMPFNLNFFIPPPPFPPIPIPLDDPMALEIFKNFPQIYIDFNTVAPRRWRDCPSSHRLQKRCLGEQR